MSDNKQDKKRTEFTAKTHGACMKDMEDDLKEKGLHAFAMHAEKEEKDGENLRDLAAEDALMMLKVFPHLFKEDDEVATYNRMVDKQNEKMVLQARKVMLGYLDRQQAETVRSIEDPYALFKVLQNFFFKRGDLSAVNAAEKDFNKALMDTKLAGKDPDKYLTTVFMNHEGVKAAHTPEEEKTFTETKLIFRVLEALDGENKVFNSTITELKVMRRIKEDSVSWVKTREMILAAQRKAEARDDKDEYDDDADDDDDLDHIAQKKSANLTVAIQDAIKKGISQGLKAMTTYDKPKITCDHCNKPGHKEADCWQKFPDKKPEWAQRRGGGGRRDQ